MKNIFLFIAGLLLISCSKEKTHGPWNLKDGQEVEVLVSHRYGATDDNLTLTSQNKTAEGSIHNFTNREAGYNYRIKARMAAPAEPPQDGPSYWLEFVKVLSKEKYAGNDPFVIELVQGSMAGPYILLRKENNQYQFIVGNITLNPATPAVATKLAEIWEYWEQAINPAGDVAPRPEVKWKSIKARVTHDPSAFGKAYLVSDIDLVLKN